MSNVMNLSAFKDAQSPKPSENGTKIGRPYRRGRQVPEDPGEKQTEELCFRHRATVKRDIEAHIEARRTYQAAVSWLAAAEAEHLSIASIEAAREDIRKFHAEMVDRRGVSSTSCRPISRRCAISRCISRKTSRACRRTW
jgi:hypothetical protein